MPSADFVSKLNDSKKLTEKKREELYTELIQMSISSPSVEGEQKGEFSPQVLFGV